MKKTKLETTQILKTLLEVSLWLIPEMVYHCMVILIEITNIIRDTVLITEKVV